jgi:hypothetical protein
VLVFVSVRDVSLLPAPRQPSSSVNLAVSSRMCRSYCEAVTPGGSPAAVTAGCADA